MIFEKENISEVLFGFREGDRISPIRNNNDNYTIEGENVQRKNQ